jgi:FAD/FMN-containing dehydrogenase/Fe-S oxidoreductase
MRKNRYREIPYNYTSADDKKIIEVLFSTKEWETLERLRSERKTGRSARLLMRIIGELFIYFRNPYLKHHLSQSFRRKKSFFSQTGNDLEIIRKYSGGNKDVLSVLDVVDAKINELKTEIEETSSSNEKISRILGGVCRKENIFFDPFNLISHITDATDWRLYPPVAIARPANEVEIAGLLKAIDSIGYKAIVCGAATGLSGGIVPLSDKCIIINTEKLNKIFPVEDKELSTDKGAVKCKTVKVQAGVITENVIKAMADKNLVFATDPTSAWASTIGGNLAENAGGKSAVQWGTAIDNVLSFEFVTPAGEMLFVERTNHQNRKILHDDTVIFSVKDCNGNQLKEIRLLGNQIRKPGLWKDITNKVLGGVPGIQKEGTDGAILNAEFILYPAFPIERTFCLEFFGENFNEASRVIGEISEAFPLGGPASLIALEHFDQEYIKAIQYKVKSNVNYTPKAVLLIDMAAHSQTAISDGEKRLTAIVERSPSTEIHIAADKAQAKKFWQDRKRLGAIAKRTNAFKLNEDIVLPIRSIAAFSDWVEEVNIREERYIQSCVIEKFRKRLEFLNSCGKKIEIFEKIPALLEMGGQTDKNLSKVNETELRKRSAVENLLHGMEEILQGYDTWFGDFYKLYEDTVKNVLILATHMHAGDGNIHVNIPVFSNDIDMMERAESLVDEVMAKTIELGGVVSGEHGIGITKIKYLDENIINELSAYRKEIDPGGLMNPGKLVSKSILNKVFTPSFNLLELEARILKRGNLETLAQKIAHCVRCGKCKNDCCVFHPAQNMFFHPRNKNLAIGSLIEAVLFEAQRYRNTTFWLLKNLEEIADHCTICHKCLVPCPVDIDTGEITILERNLLEQRGIKRTPIATKVTLKYLASTSKTLNSVMQTVVLGAGTRIQNIASTVLKPLQKVPALKGNYVADLMQAPMRPASFRTLHDYLPDCNENQTLVFEGSVNPKRTYFYFPGCGSERMFSDISLSALYILLKNGARVMIPPPFICCGFPVGVNGKEELHSKIILRDTIILSQIRDMFKHLSFDAVCVTCGTCKEALENMGVAQIFNTKVKDVMAVNMLKIDVKESVLYHKPCHDSLEENGPELISRNTGNSVTSVPHCCSEAGTLALSRPDICGAMRNKKESAFKDAINGSQVKNRHITLTNCPSCLQGLSRQAEMNLTVEHLAVYTTKHLGGKNWKKDLVEMLRNYERVTF